MNLYCQCSRAKSPSNRSFHCKRRQRKGRLLTVGGGGTIDVKEWEIELGNRKKKNNSNEDDGKRTGNKQEALGKKT